jgi:hypothetical protein
MATTRDILTRLNARSMPPTATERRTAMPTPTSIRLAPGIQDFKDRRRRRRVCLQPMYTSVSLRVLNRRDQPLEGHAINLSETGIVVEIDNLIPVGSPVTLEFTVSGLGRLRDDAWPSYAVAAEVVRIDDLTDFPKGPYRVALRFVRIPTMTQAQIARFVATQESKTVV